MTALTTALIGRRDASASAETPEVMPGGIALSVVLHLSMAALILFGLPNLFRKPPPTETPIAVQLVNISPETRATHPNPFRPKPEAKPEPPIAAPAPKPEPKPEPPAPAPEPPPSAAAPPTPPPAPSPPQPPKPEARTPPAPPAPPPPPPKPVEAQAPPPPAPPVPEPKPRPKPEPPRQVARAEPKPEPRPETKKPEPTAFNKLLKDLEDKEKKDDPRDFDSLLKNLTKHPVAQADQVPPTPRRTASLSPPSSQPRAPLGSQLSASEIDLVRDQLRPCFHPPFGAKESPDLVADITVAMNSDGTVRQARIVDTGRYGNDAVYRALADSGVRALKDPQCAPLRLPADRYEIWKTFIFGVSTKDMQ